MNRTIASKFINFLPIAGMSTLFVSLFMKWFSCGYQSEENSFKLSYIDLLKQGNITFYDFHFLSLSFATCFLLANYFSNRVGINKYFILFLLMLFPAFLCSMLESLFIAAVGYHSTVTYPCDAEPGFWLHIFGFAVILIGGYFRARRNA